MKYYTKVKDDEALFDRFALDTKKKNLISIGKFCIGIEQWAA